MTLNKITYRTLSLSFLATLLIFLSSCESDDDPDTQTPEIVADAGDDIQTEVGQEINLDASASTTTSGTLSFLWELNAAPNGSTAVINDITSEVATFTPDVGGEYSISLTATADETSQTDNLIVTATSGPMELSCSDINEEMTLEDISEGVDYFVPCMIRVNAGLIIEPGVTIEFAQEAGFEIQDYNNSQGYISAVGTEQDSIIFTGEIKTAGAWNQLELNSNDIRNTMKYCIIEYAGNSDGSKAALHFEDSKLELQNSTIRNNSSNGIFIDNSSNISGYANNNITNNKNYPLHIAANMVAQLDGQGSSYTGNMNDAGESRDEIYVFSNSIYERGYITGQDVHVWENPGVPFYINELVYVGETDEGALRIMEGCDISFGQNYGFWVDEYNASFEVKGTESEPVTIRGRSGQGSWNGIYLNTNNTANSIENAVITDGGQEAVAHWFDSPANLSLGYYGSDVFLNLSNVEINNSGGCGIAEGGGNINLSLNNVTYSGNAGSDYCN